MSRASSKRGRRAGSASLEFALIAVPFLLLLLAAADLGRYFATQQELQTVTAEAARACMVELMGGGSSCDNIQTQVEAAAPLLGPALLRVNITVLPPNADGATTITVTSLYPFTFVLPIWAADSRTITTGTTLEF